MIYARLRRSSARPNFCNAITPESATIGTVLRIEGAALLHRRDAWDSLELARPSTGNNYPPTARRCSPVMATGRNLRGADVFAQRRGGSRTYASRKAKSATPIHLACDSRRTSAVQSASQSDPGLAGT